MTMKVHEIENCVEIHEIKTHQNLSQKYVKYKRIFAPLTTFFHSTAED